MPHQKGRVREPNWVVLPMRATLRSRMVRVMSSSARVPSDLRRLRANTQVCRSVLAVGLFSTAEHAVWVAILVVAYQRGGATEAGVVSAVMLVPSALAAPFVAKGLSARRLENPMAVGYLVHFLALICAALILGFGLDPIVFYIAGTLASVTAVSSRPAHHTFVADSDFKIEAMVATGLAAGGAQLIGPLVAAAVLAFFGPVHVLVVGATLIAVAAALCAGLRARSLRPDHGDSGLSGRQSTTTGMSWALAPKAKRTVVVLLGLLGLVAVILGTAETLATEISFSAFGGQGAGTGILLAAVGVGLVLGAHIAGRLLGRFSEHAVMRIGATISGTGLIALGFGFGAAGSIAAFVFVGFGMQLVLVAGWVLLHRHVAGAETILVFGLLESQQLLGNALGAVGTGVVVGHFGVWPAVLTIGVAFPLAMMMLNPTRLQRLNLHRMTEAPRHSSTH